MEIAPLQRLITASDIAPERLAGNPRLTQEQKITEASRQFEAVLLRQILGDAQKTVIPSEFSDNSTAAGIYQDLVTNTLADNISKSGAFGLAQTFQRQLNRQAGDGPKAGHGIAPAALLVSPALAASAQPVTHHAGERKAAPHSHRPVSFSAKQP